MFKKNSRKKIPHKLGHDGYETWARNLSSGMGARNRVGIGLSHRPASLCGSATQFLTRFLESTPSPIMGPELEFLKSLWGLGTEEEEGYRTGPPGCIGWRNSFLGINSGAPYTFKNTGVWTLAQEIASLCWRGGGGWHSPLSTSRPHTTLMIVSHSYLAEIKL